MKSHTAEIGIAVDCRLRGKRCARVCIGGFADHTFSLHFLEPPPNLVAVDTDPSGLIVWGSFGGKALNESGEDIVIWSDQPGYGDADGFVVLKHGQETPDNVDADFIFLRGQWYKIPQRWGGTRKVVVLPGGVVFVRYCFTPASAAQSWWNSHTHYCREECQLIPLFPFKGWTPRKTPPTAIHVDAANIANLD